MVIDCGNYYCDDHFAICAYMESLHKPETNVIYVNYISIY